jgi:mRNA interferase HigB
MRIGGTDVLDSAMKKHRDAASSLNSWMKFVEDSVWHNLKSVRETFASADGVKVESGMVVTIFNIKGSRYRLLTSINFKLQVVSALQFITHAEYDKNAWKVNL